MSQELHVIHKSMFVSTLVAVNITYFFPCIFGSKCRVYTLCNVFDIASDAEIVLIY